MPKVPDPILNKIRCKKCNKWLSCGPVIIQPNGGSVCGRCHNYRQGPGDQYRHFAFEALACYFKFPCRYWEFHCPEALPFKKVLKHEDKCVYASACTAFFSHPSAAFKAKRRLDTRGAIKLEVIPDEVLEYLRCGNCANYLSCAPVSVCRDGTSVCHRCSAQLQQPNPEFIRDSAFEAFVDMMIFPCIFRYRGCTQYFKFGEHSHDHELECPYGKPYSREQRRSRQRPPEQEIKRQESIQHHHKERGVIETHSGHIYATITPNAPVFARPTNKQGKDIFFDEFQKHRENLASRWGRPDDALPQGDFENPRSSNSRYPGRAIGSSFSPADGVHTPSQLDRTSSMYENMGFGNELIDELRLKQHLRKGGSNGYINDVERRGSGLGANGYYAKEKEQRKMEYSVYK